MTDSIGTLETLALEVSQALEPLQDVLDPSFFVQLGLELPREIAGDTALLANLGASRDKSRALGPKSTALATAVTGGDAVAIVSAGATLIAALAELATALVALGSALNQAASALAPEQRAPLQDLAGRLSLRIVEAMLVSYLGDRLPSLTAVMDLLGLVDRSPQPAEDMEVVRSLREPTAPRLYLENFPKLLCQPGQYLQQTFGWGGVDFDGATLLRRLQSLLENLGVPAAIYQTAGSPPSLEAFVFAVQADKSVSPPGLKFDVSLPGDMTFDSTVDFSALWKGTVHVEANYAAGVEVSVLPPFTLNVRPPSGKLRVEAGPRPES